MTHRHSFLGPWYFYSVCQHKRGFCHQFVCLICILPPGATATARPPSACGVTEATCNNGQCIDRLAFLVIYIFWAEINRQRPNADRASATVAATAAMAATRLAAERTTFVNPTSTRWAPMAKRQTDIEYQMVNKRTSNKCLRSIWAPCVI